MAEEHACGMYPHDGRDLLVKLEELCELMAGVEEECVAKAEKLAALVGEASKVLVDLGLPPIRKIPHATREAREGLKEPGVILEHL
jgi:hypothetical protein